MAVIIEKFNITTEGFSNTIDVTDKIISIVREKNLESAFVEVISPYETMSIILANSDKNFVSDLINFLDNLFPINRNYSYDSVSKEANAAAILKANYLKNSASISFLRGNPILLNNQRILAIDFDFKMGSQKEILVNIIY